MRAETKKLDGRLLHRTLDSSARYGLSRQDLEMGPIRLSSCLKIHLNGLVRHKLRDVGGVLSYSLNGSLVWTFVFAIDLG